MNNNILLISDNLDTKRQITENVVLLRKSDKITTCMVKDAKKYIKNSLFCVAILHTENNNEDTLKLIKEIKAVKPELQILLLVRDYNINYILKAYDSGIYDFITEETNNQEILIKLVNCFKYFEIKEEISRNKKILNIFDIFDPKTGLYKHNYLNEIFSELSEDLRIQNGVFGIITLSDKVKTKISTNRLAIILKNSMRASDIIAIARGGYFYLVAPNIDLSDLKEILTKIQSAMGAEFNLHAGIIKIGLNSYEFLEKNAKDSLKSAIQNNEMCVSLTDNVENGNIWLEDDKTIKQFKLFQKIYDEKLQNIITPMFLRTQKECEAKFPDAKIYQYANKIESVFSINSKTAQSELIIRFNGYTKITIEINHSGLDSPENTKIERTLNKFTERELGKFLKQLKSEFKQGLEC